MNTDTTTRVEARRRGREPAQGSVGLMLGFTAAATAVFFLILGAIFVAFFAFFLIVLYASIYFHR